MDNFKLKYFLKVYFGFTKCVLKKGKNMSANAFPAHSDAPWCITQPITRQLIFSLLVLLGYRQTLQVHSTVPRWCSMDDADKSVLWRTQTI